MAESVKDNLELMSVSMPTKFPIRPKIPLLHHPPPDYIFVVLKPHNIKPHFDGIPICIELWILAEFFLHRVKFVLLLNEGFIISDLNLMFLLCDDGLS